MGRLDWPQSVSLRRRSFLVRRQDALYLIDKPGPRLISSIMVYSPTCLLYARSGARQVKHALSDRSVAARQSLARLPDRRLASGHSLNLYRLLAVPARGYRVLAYMFRVARVEPEPPDGFEHHAYTLA